MGHTYNHGMVTSQKGNAYEVIRCTFSGGAATLVDNGKSGICSTTISHPATGRYVFQLVAPWPPKVIGDPTAELSCISVTGALLTPRYVAGSFSATTGQFEIAICNTSATATDPTDGTALTITLNMQRYTT